MDDRIKHIIESGLMESYLLGQCSTEEEQEIDALLENSDALSDYLSDLEDLQFSITEKIAVAPPEELKEKIRSAVEVDNNKTGGKDKPSAGSKFNWSWIAMIASGLLFLYLLFGAFARNIQMSREIQEKDIRLMQYEEHYQNLDGMVDSLQQRMRFLLDEKTERFNLKTLTNNGELDVIAYWNAELESAVLMLNLLPEMPENQCLQIWADVEGEMKSLGVLERSTGPMSIPYLANAESLNITVEPFGGSAHPTVANLLVNASI